MKIAEDIYQISGLMNGTNSNTFIVQTKEGLVLIDAGYSENQFYAMKKSLEFWGLDINCIKDVFITHSHFDHSGNAHIFKKNGARIYIGEDDRKSVESGDSSTLEQLFGSRFHTCEVDRGLIDGDLMDYNDATIKVIGTPGHTKGSCALLADIRGKKVLFSGDLFVIQSATPADELNIELGWNGDPDFCREKCIKSFEKLRNLDVDIIAPGHSCVYYGDSIELFERLYKQALDVFK